jgi:hypothetical protein
MGVMAESDTKQTYKGRAGIKGRDLESLSLNKHTAAKVHDGVQRLCLPHVALLANSVRCGASVRSTAA